MSKVAGYDLGTSNSCACIFENGEAVVIANSEGKRTTPSIVGFGENGERKVGDPAKRQAITNPKNTVYEIKRFMGNTYSESKNEAERVSYSVVDENGFPRVDINGRKYIPQEISATILHKMRKTVEDCVGTDVKDCVITVPAYFNDAQRQATKDAAAIAGMNCLRIINEPTPAALAYGLDKADKELKIAVFDFGGGTLDLTILEFGGGVFEVLSTDGDTHLGGSDIDQKIIEWLADEFKNDEGIDLLKDTIALQRLKEAAEKAKIELSSTTSTEINLPYITAEGGVPKHLVKTLTRAKFEQLINDIIKRSIEPCERALNSAKLSKTDIDEILLVGGTTRIPAVQDAVKNFFGKEPSKGVNPDEAVAQGAAIQGAILNGDSSVGDVVLLDVTPLNLGISTVGDVMTTMIEANTTIPTKKTMKFSNAENNQSMASIVVFSGNRPMAHDNKLLGQFNIEITPSPKGTNEIEVSFDIDANGILTVSAVDKALNKPSNIKIEASSNLSKEEIERMKSEAEANAEADKKKKEEIDTINNADSLIFSIKRSMDDMGDKISEDDKNEITNAIDPLEKAISSKNVSDVKKYQEELQNKWYSVAQKAYQQGSPNETNNSNQFGDMFSEVNNDSFQNAQEV